MAKKKNKKSKNIVLATGTAGDHQKCKTPSGKKRTLQSISDLTVTNYLKQDSDKVDDLLEEADHVATASCDRGYEKQWLFKPGKVVTVALSVNSGNLNADKPRGGKVSGSW